MGHRRVIPELRYCNRVHIEVDSCAESIYSIIQFKLQHGSDE